MPLPPCLIWGVFAWVEHTAAGWSPALRAVQVFGTMAATITARYNVETVGIALAVTAATVCGAFFVAKFTKLDLTGAGGFLTAILFGVIVMSVIAIFWRNKCACHALLPCTRRLERACDDAWHATGTTAPEVSLFIVRSTRPAVWNGASRASLHGSLEARAHAGGSTS